MYENIVGRMCVVFMLVSDHETTWCGLLFIGKTAQQVTYGTEPKYGFRPCIILVSRGPDRISSKSSTQSNQNIHQIFP